MPLFKAKQIEKKQKKKEFQFNFDDGETSAERDDNNTKKN